jgi:hypothetical protein
MMPPRKETSGTLVIEPVTDRAGLRRFLKAPWPIYVDDPCWVPPLLFERLEHLDPRKNPYFDQAETAFWTARRGTASVGRISAQVNRAHLERHGDNTGHFGFLEGIDDAEVFAALLETAEGWLRERGLAHVVGPFSLSINDESGLLIEGFETPPYLMMGHARPYYARQLEAQGYRKAKDLIAFTSDMTAAPPPVVTATLAKLRGKANVNLRHLNMAHYRREIETIVDIFNDAWAENWGFIPMSPAEAAFLAKNLKPLITPEFVAIAEVGGEPAAIAVTLPNVNEAIADLDGRLLPFGWAKLLWRLKVKGTRTGRMPLMGVRRRYQNGPLGLALALGVIDAVRQYHQARGTKCGELSWVFEDNRPVRRIIEILGAKPHKTYRLYQKDLV